MSRRLSPTDAALTVPSNHTAPSNRTTPSHSTAPSQRVRRQLQQQLLKLSTPAFEQLVAQLLAACGYEQVQRLRGRGGADLRAITTQGLSRTVTLVQAKQYQRPVSRRFVDELRGSMLRRGAQQGVLLTTSSFCGPAQAAAPHGTLPIRLVEGPELLELLITHRIGVEMRPSPKGHGSGGWRLDRCFWNRLQEENEQALPHPTSHPAPGQPTQAPQPDKTLTVRRGWCDFCRRLWLFSTPDTSRRPDTSHACDAPDASSTHQEQP